MKSNAVVRIVLLSLTILLLLAILVAGLGIGTFLSEHSSGFSFREIDGQTASSGSVPASEIRNIKIEWVSGSITLQPGDTQDIAFQESGSFKKGDEMVWKQSGDTLILQFCQPKWNFFGFHSNASKDLTVTVPKDWLCRDLHVSSVSADIAVNDLTADRIDLENVSGASDLSNCSVNALDLETVSGRIWYNGTFTTLDCEAVSANCQISLDNTPERVTMDSVSGSLTLTLPEDTGFTASLDSLSGKISSDFPATINGDAYHYGDGRCTIRANGVSGDINIKKAS